jgi:hypothetical protein
VGGRADHPHPPFWKPKSVKGPSRKCRAFFHSGCSAPNDEIAYFQEQRRPDRFFPGTTTPKPLHPIIIEGVPSMVQAGGHYE